MLRQDGGNDWSAIGNGINESTDNNALVLAKLGCKLWWYYIPN